MKSKTTLKRYFLFIVLAIFSICSFFQTKEVVAEEDRTLFSDQELWEKMLDFAAFIKNMRPGVELSYGITKPNIYEDVIDRDFAKINNLDLKLGINTHRNSKFSSDLIHTNFSYLHLGNMSANIIGADLNEDEVELNIWRVSLGGRNGFGYKLGSDSKLLLFHETSSNWTVYDFVGDELTLRTQKIRDTYGETLRYGNDFSSGIEYGFTDNIGLALSYNREIVYSRHMFWYWLFSRMLEGASQGLADLFSKVVTISSPMAGPVVSFILKTGISYGYYELCKKKMNWPFNTAPAMMDDSFKIGVSIVF